jgi:hypothetical protein
MLVGGVGVRRGRRDPNHLRVGDALDFWRVEQIEPNHLLRLQAEMKVPGRAWLEFEVTPDLQSDQMADPANVSNGPLSPTEKEDRTNWRQGDQEPVNACEIRQTAIFDPQGLLGLAYWYALYPLHEFVFAGMLRGIARAAEKEPEK